ncbi:putative bifunctional diguanylate cyclase/phosphodiesterase [Roseobacter denitrificans]|nr:EAL domain-containing protein [Roseobacter denitrificans]
MTVAAAVWFASAPVLQDIQNDAKRVHLETKANVISGLLDDVVALGREAVSDANVIAFATGESVRELEARTQLSGLVNARLFDASGRLLLDQQTGQTPSPFLRVEGLAGLADMAAGKQPAVPQITYRPGSSKFDAVFQITIPLLSNEAVVALLVYEAHMDLSAVLSGADSVLVTMLLTPFQKAQWSAWNDGGEIIDVRVADRSFFVASPTVRNVFESIGFELVFTAISVAMVALLLPFALMAVSGMRAIVRPHKDLLQSQDLLAEKQGELEELAQIAEMASESVTVTDENQRILWVNRAFTTMTGFSTEEAVGRTPRQLLQGPETSAEARNEIRQAVKARRPVQTEIVNYHKDGSRYWIKLSIAPLISLRTGELRFTAIATDVTESKEAQHAISDAKRETEHQARHDPLTALPNRRYLDEVLESEVCNSAAPRTLIRVDLDHFKNVNDTLGHAAGDFVLVEVANCLRRSIGPSDLAARVGGDEFVILLAVDGDTRAATALTEKLRVQLGTDMVFEGRTCRIGASFGIATASEGLVGNEDLLKSADAALYVAKDTGRNTTTLYTPDVHHAVLAKRQLSSEIEHGIARGEFIAFFQPQIDALTEELVGVEALVRWWHPTRGILPPNEFLKVAEQLRILSDIDRQVFAYGLDCMRILNEDGLRVPKISFNVGMHQLMNPVIDYLAGQVKIGNTRVSLEVLESVLVEEDATGFQTRISELRDMGFTIEVDDFGSGHASVVGLKALNPDIMKLDRVLVSPVTESASARTLIKSMVDIGKALGISVTAEGIETAEHAAIMRDLGCDTFQGYYFARPMDFGQLREFIKDGYDSKLDGIASIAVRRDQASDNK